MKKVFMFAAAAALFAACSNEELASVSAPEAAQEQGIGFDVYTQRSVTRAGVPGDITTASLKTGVHADGFGVFAYYTSNSDYDTNSSTPNFMYNEQVTWDDPNWVYEPVKFWPNEFGNAAVSDDLDKVSFFAYAPYINVAVTTGVPTDVGLGTTAPAAPTVIKKYFTKDDAPYSTWTDADYETQRIALALPVFATPGAPTDAEKNAVVDATEGQTAGDADAWTQYFNTDLPQYRTDKLNYDLNSMAQVQKTNIIQLTKNTATGDPIVKYVVDTKPATSVDLLWGVAADENYVGMDGKVQAAGSCFIDLTKQKKGYDPSTDAQTADGKGAENATLKWNFKHALAKLNVKIVYAADELSTDPKDPNNLNGGTEKEASVFAAINEDTKVWLRSISFTGFTMKGALNLHSEDVTTVADAEPNWINIDGESELNIDEVVFYDGLKDGKEGTTNNIQKNETPTGLNIDLTQTDALSTGVTNVWQNLFYGSTDDWTAPDADASIYVIPTGEQMDVTVVYDVETIDNKLAGVLSDGSTHGSAIENKITKENVLGNLANIMLEPGKYYELRIILGLESVKFAVEVTPWVDGGDTWTNLPENP